MNTGCRRLFQAVLTGTVLASTTVSPPCGAGVPVGADAITTDGPALLHETFANLDRWDALAFRKIPKASRYEIVAPPGGGHFLLMTSKGGASGLVLKDSFDVRTFPVLRWRWRVDEAIRQVDPSRKEGDDYPARVYVIFEYDENGVGLVEGLRRRAYRALQGEDPPHSGLNYVWTAGAAGGRSYPSPYTDRVRLVVLRGKEAPLGRWAEEAVDLLADYRKLFGGDPPRRARLALMTDSDNTGQSTRAAIDYIHVSSK